MNLDFYAREVAIFFVAMLMLAVIDITGCEPALGGFVILLLMIATDLHRRHLPPDDEPASVETKISESRIAVRYLRELLADPDRVIPLADRTKLKRFADQLDKLEREVEDRKS